MYYVLLIILYILRLVDHMALLAGSIEAGRSDGLLGDMVSYLVRFYKEQDNSFLGTKSNQYQYRCLSVQGYSSFYVRSKSNKINLTIGATFKGLARPYLRSRT